MYKHRKIKYWKNTKEQKYISIKVKKDTRREVEKQERRKRIIVKQENSRKIEKQKVLLATFG